MNANVPSRMVFKTGTLYVKCAESVCVTFETFSLYPQVIGKSDACHKIFLSCLKMFHPPLLLEPVSKLQCANRKFCSLQGEFHTVSFPDQTNDMGV